MISRRAEEMTPFLVMDVLERAHEMESQGIDVVHLEVGEPDFETPEVITEAAMRAIKDGRHHYTHSLGLMELREAIAEYYAEHYGVSVDPARVMVTAGSSTAMLLVFSALLEQGQEVIISDPHYACYDNFISFVGGVPVRVPVREEEGFQFRPAEIGAAMNPNTKAIFINSP